MGEEKVPGFCFEAIGISPRSWRNAQCVCGAREKLRCCCSFLCARGGSDFTYWVLMLASARRRRRQKVRVGSGRKAVWARSRARAILGS